MNNQTLNKSAEPIIADNTLFAKAKHKKKTHLPTEIKMESFFADF